MTVPPNISIIITGSDTPIVVTPIISGSIEASAAVGTLFATFAETASFAHTSSVALGNVTTSDTATSASHALQADNAITASHADFAQTIPVDHTASYAIYAETASQALTASFAPNSPQLVGDNVLIGSQSITGSIEVTGSVVVTGSLFATSSFATSASYAETASFTVTAVTQSTSASYAETASVTPQRRYLQAGMINDQTGSLTDGNHMQFTLSRGGYGIPMTSGSGQTAGVFTLAPGKTYRLQAEAGFTFGAASGLTRYRWYDRTNAQLLGNAARVRPRTDTSDASNQPVVGAIISPTVSTEVEVRFPGGNANVTSIRSGSAEAWIQEI